MKRFAFIHGAYYRLDDQKTLLVSYHPGRRNTSTGKLTWQMWIDGFKRAKLLIVNDLLKSTAIIRLTI
jgi:uracil-DNA glycosylase